MNEFDQFVKHKLKVKYYIRYADDFVFLSQDKNELEKLIPHIEKFLDKRLKLRIHPNKIYIKTYASGVDFLGWVNFNDHRVLRDKTKKRIFNNLEKQIKRCSGVNENSKQSYLGLVSHGNTYKISGEIKSF